MKILKALSKIPIYFLWYQYYMYVLVPRWLRNGGQFK